MKKADIYRKTGQGIFKILKIRLCLIISMVLLFSSSCSDLVEEEVYSSFTADNFFQDGVSAEMGMFGIYDVITSANMYGNRYILVMNSNTDHERHWRQNRGLVDDLMANFQHSETNSAIGQMWAAFYEAVNRANVAIDGITPLYEQLTAKNNLNQSEAQELTRITHALGESHLLRGFVYFQLVKTWGDVPLKLNSKPSLDQLKTERTDKVLIYEQIEKDLVKAIDLMPEASEALSVGRANKGAARGILSRVYLNWAGFPINDVSKYPLAAEQSLAVIQSGQHALNPEIVKLTIGAPFDGMFPKIFLNLAEKVFDNTENMWELHYAYPGESGADAGLIGSWYGVLQNTRSSYKRGAPRTYMLPSFYDSFEAGDSLRRDWSVATFEIRSNDEFREIQRTGTALPKWGIGKYRRYLMPVKSPNNNTEAMNWPVVRYADVLLMYAEAVNESLLNGQTLPAGASLAQAYDGVNQIRRRARNLPLNTPDARVDRTGGGGEQFRQEVRDERSWELCSEGQRHADLVRWGIYVQTVKETGQTVVDMGYTNNDQYIAGDFIQDHHIYHPIPFAAEISQNPDILNTDPTNNGYRGAGN
ncbi:MAG: RagB/SusD family nutrient uptake outer membrane protein [Cyclobacteriaceae bacterium]